MGCGKVEISPRTSVWEICSYHVNPSPKLSGKGESFPLTNKANQPKLTCMKTKTRKTKTNDQKKSLQVFSLQKKIIEELGGFCARCGIADVRVLCLHHIVPEWKTHKNTYHDLLVNHSEHNIACLCANCHMIAHYELRNKRKGIPSSGFQSYQSFPEPIKKIKENEDKGFLSEIFQETY